MNHVNEYYRYSPLKIALHYAIRHAIDHPCMHSNKGFLCLIFLCHCYMACMGGRLHGKLHRVGAP